MKEQRPRWSSHTKIVISLLLLALGVYLLDRFGVILPPVTLAIILAFILSPLVNRFQSSLRVPRVLAIFLTYLVLLSALSALPFLVIPALVNQLSGLNLDLQRIFLGAKSWLASEYLIAGQVINVDETFQQVAGLLEKIVEPVFGQTLELAIDLISALVWAIFIIVVSFYLIKDAQALRTWLEDLTPPAYRSDYIQLRTEINQIWSSFFRGQLILAGVVTVIFAVIGFLLGLPFALAMGVLAGLLEFLPSIGHGIWLLIASLLTLSAGSTWLPLPNWAFTLVIVGLHLFYQQFDLNYLIPRIIGRSVHLPPLVVILGIVMGAVMAGVLGILLAAPTIASARVLGRYIYANLFNIEPFQASIVSPLSPPNPRWWRKPASAKAGDLSD